MKRIAAALLLFVFIAGCAQKTQVKGNIRVFGDGTYDAALAAQTDLVILVMNGSEKNRIKLQGFLDGAEVFSGRYKKEHPVRRNGGFVDELPVSYYYVSLLPGEHTLSAEGKKAFAKETFALPAGEKRYALVSYDSTGISIRLSKTPSAFA